MRVYIVFIYQGYEEFEVLGVYKTKRRAINAYSEWYQTGDPSIKEWNNEDANENEHIIESILK
jgi:hypothetical protein